MRISTRGLRAAFLALGVLLMAGMVTGCDDSGGAGDAAPPPAQN